MREATCRSCGALVLWAKSVKTGKWIVLNATPTLDGSVEVKKGKLTDTFYCRVLTPEQAGSRRLYTSHFASCPQADEWRR